MPLGWRTASICNETWGLFSSEFKSEADETKDDAETLGGTDETAKSPVELNCPSAAALTISKGDAVELSRPLLALLLLFLDI